MKVRTQEHYNAIKDLIGCIGMHELLEALAEIAEGHGDVQTRLKLPVGSSKLLAAGLSDLAERYAYARSHELHQ